MKNIFEETYTEVKKAEEAYEKAADEKERDAARKMMKAAEEKINEKGDIAWTVYRAYKTSKEYENEILNFNNIIWDRDVEALTACMKENGITAFTYSCKATDAVETLWLFKQAGCTIGDMIEVNIGKGFTKDGYKKAHAFKLSIN